MLKKFLNRVTGSTRVLLLGLVGGVALYSTSPVVANIECHDCKCGGELIGSYADLGQCVYYCRDRYGKCPRDMQPGYCTCAEQR